MAVFSFISFTRAYFTPHEGWRHISVHFVLFVVSFPSIYFFKGFSLCSTEPRCCFFVCRIVRWGGVRTFVLENRTARCGAVRCGFVTDNLTVRIDVVLLKGKSYGTVRFC